MRPIPSPRATSRALVPLVLSLLALAFLGAALAQGEDKGEAPKSGTDQVGLVAHELQMPTTSVLPPVDSVSAASVVDYDERFLVDTTQPPAPSVAHLEIHDALGWASSCTGTIIGPRAVLTAAHCLTAGSGSLPITGIRVVPARSGDSEPYGSQWAQALGVPNGFDPDSQQGSEYDYAIVILPNAQLTNSAGAHLGPLTAMTTAQLEAQADWWIVGYPGDCDWSACWQMDFGYSPYGDYMWADWFPGLVYVDGDFIYHAIDTWAGQSGAALFRNSDHAIAGVHAISVNFTTGEVVNRAVRLTPGRIQALVDFCGQYSGCSIPVAGQSHPTPTNTPPNVSATNTPTATPTDTPTLTPTNTPTVEPETPTPSATPTPQATATPDPGDGFSVRVLEEGLNLIGGPIAGDVPPEEFVACLPQSAWQSLFVWHAGDQTWTHYFNTTDGVPDYVNDSSVGGIDVVPRGSGVVVFVEDDMPAATFPNTAGAACP